MQGKHAIFTIHSEDELSDIPLQINPGDRIFFRGDLGVGKTTYIRLIIQRILQDQHQIVRSPTYTYYQEYGTSPRIYHFDLYRIDHYSTFASIGGEEIAHDPTNIMLIEWPEILGTHIKPTIIIDIHREADNARRIEIQY